MLVGGLTRFSTIDLPDHLAAVVFLQGCPLRCRYCHNPHLQAGRPDAGLPWQDVLAWLGRRVGLLDGVVFSGGEPTLQAGLEDALAEVRRLGFITGLHSAGPYPRRLAPLLKRLDWIGLDIKAPFATYEQVTGVSGSGTRARRSLELVLESGIACELRTTLHPDLLGPADLLAIAEDLHARGVTNWVVQEFRPQGCADADLRAAETADIAAMLAPLRRLVPGIVLR